MCAAGIAIGALLHALDAPGPGDAVWAGTVAVMLVPLTWSVFRAMLHGDFGVDLIALLAMASALATGEFLAGAVIALMLSGGNALEASASRRARRELTALLERAPRIAHRREGDSWVEIPVDGVVAGDVVLVRAGEVVPVDGDGRRRRGGRRRVGDDGRVAAGCASARRAGAQRLRRTPATPSSCARAAPRAESAYAAIVRARARRPRPSGRRSCASPTATRCSSCR